ncbi:MAG TPA: DNA-3-methyladenine glycosylase [Chloroflexi bacterium]|nr:MAG: DNA-3-methyladenine glycosylase [Chloroflexota bacterium]HDN04668.1 DNA-3-methyladenine glycosylase [Chloroflexota bacterium]
MSNHLPESFFSRDTVQVARDLVGKRLVRLEGNQRISGIILETEAYRGEEDLACHCRAGRTPRTEIMYGPAGRAYIYLIYGMYWLLNFVTESEGSPGAVLIRALVPEEGKEKISQRRGNQPEKHWTDGPGKICIALGINADFNGLNSCTPQAKIFVENGLDLDPGLIHTGPRVGLESVPEPWRSIPWRFVVNYQHLLNGS